MNSRNLFAERLNVYKIAAAYIVVPSLPMQMPSK
jgi:hypothetical protein